MATRGQKHGTSVCSAEAVCSFDTRYLMPSLQLCAIHMNEPLTDGKLFLSYGVQGESGSFAWTFPSLMGSILRELFSHVTVMEQSLCGTISMPQSLKEHSSRIPKANSVVTDCMI